MANVAARFESRLAFLSQLHSNPLVRTARCAASGPTTSRRSGLSLGDIVGEDVTVERVLDRVSLADVPNGQGQRDAPASLARRCAVVVTLD